MKKIILVTFLSTLSSTVYSSSLQDQLSAVAQAEQQGANEEKKQHDDWVAERNKQIQQDKQRRANAQAAANKKAAAAAAERQARQDKRDTEALQDKKRDQGYEDELRSLEIQKQKLALAKEEARVKRENEFIDQELKNKAAQTDVTQSEADANRNISEGGRDLMKSEGKAREDKADSWFN
ncbi:DUF5384 family protein [Citrobacter portucalensis]|uniref:DUF5384 family protein n=1 Tax=Citrobacter TaxID=544 RepID=UPI000F6EC90F|nr:MULTISPECIES: DUF5384 family protein [Citrobacter]MBD0806250.1 DUF5384 family protein [Citrobacter sp. C13]MBJ9849116.1 DUF5384 family protein [Citrobacter freundii]KAA0542477.1 hypothetical protein F0328_14220 [Citrobacter portucalensis]MDE9680475.1 DUF5384 family protein [Citrobacter portucalensis]MDM2782585.1 DUF5384 family protein [Citrobacter sp. Cpo137]